MIIWIQFLLSCYVVIFVDWVESKSWNPVFKIRLRMIFEINYIDWVESKSWYPVFKFRYQLLFEMNYSHLPTSMFTEWKIADGLQLWEPSSCNLNSALLKWDELSYYSIILNKPYIDWIIIVYHKGTMVPLWK